MSGHSKWSKVKHQKASVDVARGKIFTKLSNAITIAVKEGGGITDPSSNFKLRLAIEKARSYNMPKDKIERAIERAKKGEKGTFFEKVIYEAFGPSGVGIIIEAATDNRQRTVSEIKNLLERAGGRLAESGSVAHLFNLLGLIIVSKNGRSFDQVMEAALEAGAVDIEESGDAIEIWTALSDLHKIKENLLNSGFTVSSAEPFYRPIVTVPIDKEETAKKIVTILEQIEELDDVQKVYANFDIPDQFLSL